MGTCETCHNGHCCNDLGCGRISSLTLADLIKKAMNEQIEITAIHSLSYTDYELVITQRGDYHWQEYYPNQPYRHRGSELRAEDIIATDWVIL